MAAIEAIILADSGPQVGLGHLRRCLVLATALGAAGASVRFLTPDDEAQQIARRAFAASRSARSTNTARNTKARS